MDTQLLHLDTPGAAAAWLHRLFESRLARAGQRLKLAATMVAAGSQFIPLGENSQMLADLAARVHAARTGGA